MSVPRNLFSGILVLAQVLVGLSLVGAGVGSFTPVEAMAQARSFDAGPVVRRNLLFRSDRIEISPSFGTEAGRVYERGLVVGLSADYHLTNMFSIGLNTSMMPVALRKPMYSNFRELNPERAARVATARTFAAGDLHVGIVPFSGKLSNLGRRTLYYDVQIQAGFGVVFRTSDADDLSGIRPAPTAAVNGRLFLRDDLALRLRVQNYIHESADAQLTRRSGLEVPVEESLRQHYMVTLGVSLFFPETVRISR